MKKWGVIKPDEWSGSTQFSITKRLGRELRGYAYGYKTPQVFCFDATYLLLVQFRAENREHIKNSSCPVDCMVVPRLSTKPDRCTIRQAFYRAATQGLRCYLAKLAPPVTIGGYPRRFQYFSGRPVWESAQGMLDTHPQNFSRVRSGSLCMEVGPWRSARLGYDILEGCVII